MSGFSSLRDILVIKYDLMRHLRLQPSEIMALPVVERNRYHKWIRDEVEARNAEVEDYKRRVKALEDKVGAGPVKR